MDTKAGRFVDTLADSLKLDKSLDLIPFKLQKTEPCTKNFKMNFVIKCPEQNDKNLI